MDLKNQVPKVYSSWANKLTFPAQHAFPDLLKESCSFSPDQESMDPPDVQIHEMPGCAGGCATAAGNTLQHRRLCFYQVFPDIPAIPVIIDLPVGTDRISEFLWYHRFMRFRFQMKSKPSSVFLQV
jgi:hypothetical protein